MVGSAALASYEEPQSKRERDWLVGTLDAMCSSDEAAERERMRQLDIFERRPCSDHRAKFVADLALVTKSYQRSAADKVYLPSEVRTPDACRRTAEFLVREVLDLDNHPQPLRFAADNISFAKIYDYVRNRLRAVRVDLNIQGPDVMASACFMEVYEWCFRFELLALGLLGHNASSANVEKGGRGDSLYDYKLGLSALAQTFEPLLASYRLAREMRQSRRCVNRGRKGGQTSRSCSGMRADGREEREGEEHGGAEGQGRDDCLSSPSEAAVQRLVILLLASHAPAEVAQHISKLEPCVLRQPSVMSAVGQVGDFLTGNAVRFLKGFQDSSFLCAVAMSHAAASARMRALVVLARVGAPSLADRFPLTRLMRLLALRESEEICGNEECNKLEVQCARNFLELNGVSVEGGDAAEGDGRSEGCKAVAKAVLPKRADAIAAGHPLYNSKPGLSTQGSTLTCDAVLATKFHRLGLRRADVVFGLADPIGDSAAHV